MARQLGKMSIHQGNTVQARVPVRWLTWWLLLGDIYNQQSWWHIKHGVFGFKTIPNSTCWWTVSLWTLCQDGLLEPRCWGSIDRWRTVMAVPTGLGGHTDFGCRTMMLQQCPTGLQVCVALLSLQWMALDHYISCSFSLSLPSLAAYWESLFAVRGMPDEQLPPYSPYQPLQNQNILPI